MDNNILNKFEINIEEDKLWYFNIENGKEVKKLVENDLKGSGQYNYQVFYQLDRENKDHWINYTIKYAHNKVWIDFWYKKRYETNNEVSGQKEKQIIFYNYKKRIEKTDNLMSVEFTKEDEWIKITNPNELEGKYKEKGYRWVKKYDWENK